MSETRQHRLSRPVQGPDAGLSNAGHGHHAVAHELQLVQHCPRWVLRPVLGEVVSGLSNLAGSEMLHENGIAVAVPHDGWPVLQSDLC